MWKWGLVSHLNSTYNFYKNCIYNISSKPNVCFPACMPSACRATGRGLQPTGLRVKQIGDFKVDTRNAGSGDLKVAVKGPSEYRSHCRGYRSTERK